MVDATDSDEAWVVRYDDDGLKFETGDGILDGHRPGQCINRIVAARLAWRSRYYVD